MSAHEKWLMTAFAFGLTMFAITGVGIMLEMSEWWLAASFVFISGPPLGVMWAVVLSDWKQRV